MIQIPEYWMNDSRKLAEKHRNEFEKMYPYWEKNIHGREEVELHFLLHMGNELYDRAKKSERAKDPEKAFQLYCDSSGAYQNHIELAQRVYLMGSIRFISYDINRIGIISQRLKELEPPTTIEE